MAEKFIYHMRDLRKFYSGGKEVLKGIHLSFYPGAKIGVIGGNGAGKSTLLRIMAGQDQDFVGEAWLAKGYTVGYLPQEPQLNEDKDVLGNVKEAVQETQDLLDEFEDVSARMGEPMSDDEMNQLLDKQSILLDKIEAIDAWSLDSQLEVAMDALRLPPSDADVKVLSGGERRRVAICKLLLSKPDLLLLDEPTNHLDAESVAWLEQHLRQYHGTIVLITHDRYFLDNVTEWILELDAGRGIPWEGNYSTWLEKKQEKLAQKEKNESARQRALKEELSWIRSSPKGRQSKSKARVRAYEQLLSEQTQEQSRRLELRIPPGPRLGELVVEVENLSKSFGDRLLIDDLTFKIPPGAIVGIIGPNGAGKSTLFKMLMQQQEADSGTIRIGPTVKASYVDQSRGNLVAENSIWQEISEGAEVIEVGRDLMNSRAYVGAFGFKGSDQQKLVGKLSGGERNRVHLAKLLKSKGNLILLDEPTNDLDVDTLRCLEDALLTFPGCALIISHDRYFLDRLATHILAFEGDSHVEWFEGNYQDYEADRKKRLGPAAEIPSRIKYRKFTR